MDTFQKANQYSLLGTTKMQRLRELAASVVHVNGAFAELGVYKGGSAFLLASDHPDRTLHLFDTFAGMPISGKNDHHEIGEFPASLDDVKKLVGEKAQYHVGLFPDTTKGLEFEKYSFVHIDADQEQSTFDACTYFWPRLAPGGVMLFDDYEWRDCPGVKMAMTRFARDNGVAIQTLGNHQAMFTKPRVATKKGQVVLKSHCKGIGDAICGMYAACGIAAAGYEVFNYSKHTMWLNRASYPNVHILDAETLPIPDNAIDISALYDEQLRDADCRKTWYCENFAREMGLPKGSLKPAVPNVDKTIHKPREDAGTYIVAHGSSAYPVRDWSIPRWHELINELNQHGIKTIGIDAPNQQARVQKIFGGVDAVYVWGSHADDVADMMLQAKAVVGIDSGMTHFAGLLGVPTFCVTAIMPEKVLWNYTNVKQVKVNAACSPCRFGWDGKGNYKRLKCNSNGCAAINSLDGATVAKAVLE